MMDRVESRFRRTAGDPLGRSLPAPDHASIHPALRSDAEAILRLQRDCYRSEAERYNDWTIPPLTQTLAGLEGEFLSHRILVARLGPAVVGSVRGRHEGGVCHVGRLVVDPASRRQGLGSRLMSAIEGEFPDADCFELFTGHLSDDNLRLYRRLGYAEDHRQAVSPRLTLIYLRKSNHSPSGSLAS